MPLNKETKPNFFYIPDIGMMVRVFANSPVDLGSIPYQRLKEMVLDAFLINTQKYKFGSKSKVEQSRERGSALLYTTV